MNSYHLIELDRFGCKAGFLPHKLQTWIQLGVEGIVKTEKDLKDLKGEVTSDGETRVRNSGGESGFVGLALNSSEVEHLWENSKLSKLSRQFVRVNLGDC